ncbi:MAG: hypothetical protein WCC21_12425 [Candidatus Acidiferrales bacterium]
MACYSHHCLIAGLGLSKLGDCVVAQIVKAKSGGRALHFTNVGLAHFVLAGIAGVLL